MKVNKPAPVKKNNVSILRFIQKLGIIHLTITNDTIVQKRKSNRNGGHDAEGIVSSPNGGVG